MAADSLASRLLHARAGDTLCILGNEAIARGAIEAGVRVVAGYPGTPASEIGDTFARIHADAGILFEWSVNEKVALEVAFGAAVAGARSLCHMKHLGLAAAGDPLGTIPYVGVAAGMVVVSAGDPGMVVSPNEQDQRLLARMNSLPVLEPSTPAEARVMTRLAFALSQECGLPVILRTTPEVAHTRSVVEMGHAEERAEVPDFHRRPAQLTPIPGNARRMRVELDQRLARAALALERAGLFEYCGAGGLGVVAAGPPAAVVLDQIEEMAIGDRLTVLRAGATHPLPRPVLERFLDGVDRVLVVEELTPFIEDELRSLAYEVRPQVEILGKRSGHLPARFGYTPDLVADALAAFAGVERPRPGVATAPELPPRPPTLCPGCSHRSAYLAVRTVFGDEGLYFNDIGCYTLGYGPPLRSVDALLSMGSSIAMAAAASRVLGRKTLAFIGDSTFFHSGMPALLNAAETAADVVVVVLDNRITAMTGHQPSPTTPGSSRGEDRCRPSPEAVARGLGIASVRTVDPNDLKATVTACMQARGERGPSVIVARRDCAIVRFREQGAAPARRRFVIDLERCRHCGHEAAGLHCGQGPSGGYERALVLRRILDQGAGDDVEPSTVELEAPCAVACPANICVQGYVGKVAGGRYAEALALIRRRNPLPVVSSRVCHRPCEKVCTRRNIDGAVAVNDLKRFLVDWEMAAGQGAAPLVVGQTTGRRVAVVGAGPSGLACAHELRLRGHQVVVFDEHRAPGGLLVQAIPAHRLPRDVLRYETDWVLGHGIDLEPGVRLGRDITVTGLLDDGFDAVFLGFGAMVSRRLGVPGDDIEGTVGALDLLRRHHVGEDLGAAGRSFVVVGGGDAALDAARTVARLGARSVRIVYRRSRDEMPAHAEELVAAEEEGVEILTRRAPVMVLGERRTRGLRVIETEPGSLDASGRRSPVELPGTEVDVEADVVVAAVGQRPDPGVLDVELELTADGAVVVHPETGATSMAGVFAGGDLVPGPKTVIDAIADGRRGAYGIDLHLAEGVHAVAPLDFVNPEGQLFFSPRLPVVEQGQRATMRPAHERRHDHHDVVQCMTEEEARQEASRCLLCAMCASCSACTDLFGCPAFVDHDGRMHIDQALCNGCGVCVAMCPNGAIHEVEA